MTRCLVALALVLLALPHGWAQPAERVPAEEEKGTYLGVLISPVPEVLYDQMPELPRGQGVVVSHVLPDSPAAQAGLLRHDILLRYNDDAIRDCEHFARLIRAGRAGQRIKLELLRTGRKQSAEVVLALGPVLKIAQPNRSMNGAVAEVAPGRAKAGSPPSVSVAATPLDGGRLRVAIEYYQDGTGKLRTVNCEGTLDEIDQDVKKLPHRVQTMAQKALTRFRALDLQQAEHKVEAAAPSKSQ
ncbi:MAG TPA: PDZ domain-containing protein [Gemmataceae bacterium]|nr:PDZ domain-containing protein [Gemmataceae bacterium]